MKKVIYSALIFLLLLSGCTDKQDVVGTKTSESEIITKKSDFISELPLHDAVRAKDFQLVKMLVENGSLINSTDKYGYTPLHLASRLNQYEIAEFLISKKASVNSVDIYEDTPLIDSTRNSTNSMSRLLLCNGADKNIEDKHKMSPLHNSSKNSDLYIVEMIESNDITQMCKKLDITLDYYDENENKICGSIVTGHALKVDLTITDELSENINPFGKYNAELTGNKYCAYLDKEIDKNNSYIVTAIGTNSIDKDVEISNLNDLTRKATLVKPEKTNEQTIYIAGLYEDLMKEFAADFKPWNAELDKNGLVFRFKKPELLFDHGSSKLSNEYKTILDNFFPRYLSVLNKYKNEISLVRVEGHTSSVYSNAKNDEERYSKNKILSTSRAQAVYNHTLSIDNDLVSSDMNWLNNYYKAFGMAYDDLIYNNDGSENELLSRRVEFRINKIVK